MSSIGIRTEPDTSRTYAWTAVGFLWLTFLLNYVDRQFVFSVFPVLKREIGFTDAQLGLIGSLFIWTYCLFMAPAGRLADIVRRDRLILLSLLLWSTATLGTGMARSVGAVLFWRVVMGITESLYMPAAVGLIAMLHPGENRSKALAIHGTAQVFGVIAGGWSGGWAAEHIGWRTGFALLGAAGIAYALVLAAVFRRLPASRPVQTSIRGAAREVLRSPAYIALVLAFLSFGSMIWLLYAWLPTLIHERYRLSLAASGLAATAYVQLSSAAGVLVSGYAADWLVRRTRAGRFYVAAAGLLLASPFAYATVAASSLTQLQMFAAAFGFFGGMVMTTVFAAAYDVVAERNYGLSAGILNGIPGIASGTGVFLAGVWKQTVGIAPMMLWVAVSGVAAGSLLASTAACTLRTKKHPIATSGNSAAI